MLLLISVALFAAGVWSTRVEPRRLLNGILLLGGSATLLLALVGAIITVDPDPNNHLSGLALLGLLALASAFAALIVTAWVVYGIETLRRERFSPASVLALLFGLGLMTYVTTGIVVAYREPGGSTVLAAVLSLLPAGYLSFLFIAFVGYAWLYGRLARRTPPSPAVVVLGAGLLGGHRVSPLLAARLSKGIEVYERGRANDVDTVVVASGGQGPDEQVAEGRAMADWLITHGVPEQHVLVENRSTTTRENLIESRAVLAGADVSGPVTVVTNNYHAFRAATLMRTLGMPGAAVGAATARYFWCSAVLREFVAMLRDHLRVHLVMLGLLCLPLLVLGVNALREVLP